MPAQPIPATFISACSGREFPVSEQVDGHTLRPTLLTLIQQDHPDFTRDNYLAISELNTYRRQYIQNYLLREVGELSDLEQTVLDHIEGHSTLTDKLEEEVEPLTLGQRLADRIAAFGGSWTFILSFFGVLLLWIVLNAWWLRNGGFDPYPFILLNLLLSCLAAMQAPVIMMSQNRQEDKDRQRAKKDYMINLKSELEIRMLHEKLDHLILHQQQDLLEIQRIQVEMMNDILARLETSSTPAKV
ncbi:DUF1003 domain-containing protein [Hymenobacter sp. BT491]|uniref:DUF1003 domain-containing protein n=1 Tax=Hymenobacter sp. BT491 TaxID=2766779 RepID=UPI0016535D77|nr:DUF1003 domain-containing protein [Hymenobacter sp. BT491]MBC6990539.1 DUF1003 domain-containing protein [Hymenobacter sp. BT491]